MNIFNLCIFCFFVFCARGAGSTWLDDRMREINSVSEPPTPEQVVLLGQLATIDPKNEDGEFVVAQALKRLDEIPQFSRYFHDYIVGLKSGWLSGNLNGDYDRMRFSVFQAMKNIPDSGIIGVLGVMLYDGDWTKDPIAHMNSGADWSLTPPNGFLAAEALAELIDNPPIKKNPKNYTEDDLEDWRLWYERVKAGNQTFRFKGDPQEYTLAGPSDRKIEDLSASRSSREKSSGSSGKVTESETGESSDTPWIAVAVALGLCIAAVWLAFKKRKVSA